ncbi:Hypothetical protein Ccan_15650 [Capnocytophaga canimorsus Cc5]|uniref:Uncharacterized protein n=1 Tax=Capnocytophaga canimorsus (strain 5) TaxID=860228 RepID=F9YRF1_CAPCC|nr:Hypothetical protein Ccan_15650 [Capnocytophaga canimorsus Cc5]
MIIPMIVRYGSFFEFSCIVFIFRMLFYVFLYLFSVFGY